jgi:hypothetical protein
MFPNSNHSATGSRDKEHIGATAMIFSGKKKEKKMKAF